MLQSGLCGEPDQPLHKHAWERKLSPVKKSNTDFPLGTNSLTCHFSGIIRETKLIPSCWFFLTASLPSKAVLYFLFSHSLFFLTLSPGSSIISNNLYFLSLPSYCFVFSSQSLIHIKLVLSLSSSPWASLLPAVEAAADSQLCALHYVRAGCDFGSCTPARLAHDIRAQRPPRMGTATAMSQLLCPLQLVHQIKHKSTAFPSPCTLASNSSVITKINTHET